MFSGTRVGSVIWAKVGRAIPLAANRSIRLHGLEDGVDVVCDGELTKDRGLLGEVSDAHPRPDVQGGVDDGLSVQDHRSAERAELPQDCPEAGRLAGAIRAQEPDGLASLDVQGNVFEYGATLDTNAELIYTQHG